MNFIERYIMRVVGKYYKPEFPLWEIENIDLPRDNQIMVLKHYTPLLESTSVVLGNWLSKRVGDKWIILSDDWNVTVKEDK